MLQKMLDMKSKIEISDGKWKIVKEYSESNQIGSNEKDDVILLSQLNDLVP